MTRWPVRVRLTVLFAAAFFAAGVVLVAVTYWLVSRSLLQPIEHDSRSSTNWAHTDWSRRPTSD